MDLLKDTEVDRGVKIWSIAALADTLTLTKDNFYEFMRPTMNVLVAASKWSVTFDENEFDDLKDYLLQLQTILIEAFTTIIQAIDDCSTKIKEIVGDFLSDIIFFLQGCSR